MNALKYSMYLLFISYREQHSNWERYTDKLLGFDEYKALKAHHSSQMLDDKHRKLDINML